MVISGRKIKSALKIAIDCGSVSYIDANHYGGISTVTLNLIGELAKIDRQNRYSLYSFASLAETFPKRLTNRMHNIVLPKIGYHAFWLPLALRLSYYDVFLAMSQAVPWGSGNTFGFVYDLAFLHYPQFYPNSKKLKRQTDDLINHSSHLITTSEAVKDDIIKTYRYSNLHLSVCYPGAADIYVAKGSKYVDIKPYCLYVGSLAKSKNIPHLLVAFSRMRKQTNKDLRLVIVGSRAQFDPDIEKVLLQEKLVDNVVFAGFVKTEDLPKYYRGALVLILASHYEGFGLPLLEAMSCGCPVIASQNGAPGEVIGNAGILVDTNNIKNLTVAMIKVVTDDKYRIRLKKAVLKEAQRFSNRKFAKVIMGIIDKYCRKHEYRML